MWYQKPRLIAVLSISSFVVCAWSPSGFGETGNREAFEIITRSYTGAQHGGIEIIRTFQHVGQEYIECRTEELRGVNGSAGHKDLPIEVPFRISEASVDKFVSAIRGSEQYKEPNLNDFGVSRETVAPKLSQFFLNLPLATDVIIARAYNLRLEESDLQAGLNLALGNRFLNRPMVSKLHAIEVKAEHISAQLGNFLPWRIRLGVKSWISCDPALEDLARQFFSADPLEGKKASLLRVWGQDNNGTLLCRAVLNEMIRRCASQIVHQHVPPDEIKILNCKFSGFAGRDRDLTVSARSSQKEAVLDEVLWKMQFEKGILQPRWNELVSNIKDVESSASQISWLREWKDLAANHKAIVNMADTVLSRLDVQREGSPTDQISQVWKKHGLQGLPNRSFILLVNNEQAAILFTNEMSAKVLGFACERTGTPRRADAPINFKSAQFFLANKTELPNQVYSLDSIFKPRLEKDIQPPPWWLN